MYRALPYDIGPVDGKGIREKKFQGSPHHDGAKNYENTSENTKPQLSKRPEFEGSRSLYSTSDGAEDDAFVDECQRFDSKRDFPANHSISPSSHFKSEPSVSHRLSLTLRSPSPKNGVHPKLRTSCSSSSEPVSACRGGHTMDESYINGIQRSCYPAPSIASSTIDIKGVRVSAADQSKSLNGIEVVPTQSPLMPTKWLTAVSYKPLTSLDVSHKKPSLFKGLPNDFSITERSNVSKENDEATSMQGARVTSLDGPNRLQRNVTLRESSGEPAWLAAILPEHQLGRLAKPISLPLQRHNTSHTVRNAFNDGLLPNTRFQHYHVGQASRSQEHSYSSFTSKVASGELTERGKHCQLGVYSVLPSSLQESPAQQALSRLVAKDTRGDLNWSQVPQFRQNRGNSFGNNYCRIASQRTPPFQQRASSSLYITGTPGHVDGNTPEEFFTPPSTFRATLPTANQRNNGRQITPQILTEKRFNFSHGPPTSCGDNARSHFNKRRSVSADHHNSFYDCRDADVVEDRIQLQSASPPSTLASVLESLSYTRNNHHSNLQSKSRFSRHGIRSSGLRGDGDVKRPRVYESVIENATRYRTPSMAAEKDYGGRCGDFGGFSSNCSKAGKSKGISYFKPAVGDPIRISASQLNGGGLRESLQLCNGLGPSKYRDTAPAAGGQLFSFPSFLRTNPLNGTKLEYPPYPGSSIQLSSDGSSDSSRDNSSGNSNSENSSGGSSSDSYISHSKDLSSKRCRSLKTHNGASRVIGHSRISLLKCQSRIPERSFSRTQANKGFWYRFGARFWRSQGTDRSAEFQLRKCCFQIWEECNENPDLGLATLRAELISVASNDPAESDADLKRFNPICGIALWAVIEQVRRRRVLWGGRTPLMLFTKSVIDLTISSPIIQVCLMDMYLTQFFGAPADITCVSHPPALAVRLGIKDPVVLFTLMLFYHNLPKFLRLYEVEPRHPRIVFSDASFRMVLSPFLRKVIQFVGKNARQCGQKKEEIRRLCFVAALGCVLQICFRTWCRSKRSKTGPMSMTEGGAELLPLLVRSSLQSILTISGAAAFSKSKEFAALYSRINENLSNLSPEGELSRHAVVCTSGIDTFAEAGFEPILQSIDLSDSEISTCTLTSEMIRQRIAAELLPSKETAKSQEPADEAIRVLLAYFVPAIFHAFIVETSERNSFIQPSKDGPVLFKSLKIFATFAANYFTCEDKKRILECIEGLPSSNQQPGSMSCPALSSEGHSEVSSPRFGSGNKQCDTSNGSCNVRCTMAGPNNENAKILLVSLVKSTFDNQEECKTRYLQKPLAVAKDRLPVTLMRQQLNQLVFLFDASPHNDRKTDPASGLQKAEDCRAASPVVPSPLRPLPKMEQPKVVLCECTTLLCQWLLRQYQKATILAYREMDNEPVSRRRGSQMLIKQITSSLRLHWRGTDSHFEQATTSCADITAAASRRDRLSTRRSTCRASTVAAAIDLNHLSANQCRQICLSAPRNTAAMELVMSRGESGWGITWVSCSHRRHFRPAANPSLRMENNIELKNTAPTFLALGTEKNLAFSIYYTALTLALARCSSDFATPLPLIRPENCVKSSSAENEGCFINPLEMLVHPHLISWRVQFSATPITSSEWVDEDTASPISARSMKSQQYIATSANEFHVHTEISYGGAYTVCAPILPYADVAEAVFANLNASTVRNEKNIPPLATFRTVAIALIAPHRLKPILGASESCTEWIVKWCRKLLTLRTYKLLSLFQKGDQPLSDHSFSKSVSSIERCLGPSILTDDTVAMCFFVNVLFSHSTLKSSSSQFDGLLGCHASGVLPSSKEHVICQRLINKGLEQLLSDLLPSSAFIKPRQNGWEQKSAASQMPTAVIKQYRAKDTRILLQRQMFSEQKSSENFINGQNCTLGDNSHKYYDFQQLGGPMINVAMIEKTATLPTDEDLVKLGECGEVFPHSSAEDEVYNNNRRLPDFGYHKARNSNALDSNSANALAHSRCGDGLICRSCASWMLQIISLWSLRLLVASYAGKSRLQFLLGSVLSRLSLRNSVNGNFQFILHFCNILRGLTTNIIEGVADADQIDTEIAEPLNLLPLVKKQLIHDSQICGDKTLLSGLNGKFDKMQMGGIEVLAQAVTAFLNSITNLSMRKLAMDKPEAHTATMRTNRFSPSKTFDDLPAIDGVTDGIRCDAASMQRVNAGAIVGTKTRELVKSLLDILPQNFNAPSTITARQAATRLIESWKKYDVHKGSSNEFDSEVLDSIIFNDDAESLAALEGSTLAPHLRGFVSSLFCSKDRLQYSCERIL